MLRNPNRKGFPLWLQLLTTLLLTSAVLALAGGEFVRDSESKRVLSRAQEDVIKQLDLVSALSADALAAGEFGQVRRVMASFTDSSPDIHFLEFVDSQGKIMAGWRRPGAVTEQLLSLSAAMNNDAVPGIHLRAGWDAGPSQLKAERHIDEARRNIFLMLLVATVMLMAWSVVLVIRPLRRIDQRLLHRSEAPLVTNDWWVPAELQNLNDSVILLEEVTAARDALEQEVERRKDAEVALLSTRDDAVDASRAKSSFLANMSHELRTPLNAIIGYSEMMREEAGERGHTEYLRDLDRIQNAGQHLLELIREVLDLSKIEAGKMELYLEPVDLSDLARGVAATIEPMARRNNNRIRLQGLAQVRRITADGVKVRQVLLNLLSNAAKFTENGEIVVAATGKTLGDRDGVELVVSDTGIGLAEKDINNLFEPFQQADPSTTRKYGGTGLGLALCRRLCDLMGGDIWVQSEPGCGARFGVWFPIRVEGKVDIPIKASPARKITQDPKKVRMPEEGARPLPADNRRRRIATVLTIDDDPNVLDLMARVYNREGFRTATAGSGSDGLDMAGRLRPDLITLDIMMPAMDGWAVLETLKADPLLRDIPVIMVSIVENKPMALEMGALASLTKPIAWDRLLDLTRLAVRGRLATAGAELASARAVGSEKTAAAETDSTPTMGVPENL